MLSQGEFVAVVDYGMGNLRSVEKGCLKVGLIPRVTSSPEEVRQAKAIVLPGVGAFRDCIHELTRLKLLDTIIKSIQDGKPYLGICLGLQILFTESEEFGHYEGMNIFPGRVIRFSNPTLKVPHMGWNSLNFQKNSPIFEGIDNRSFFYFVHSYYVIPDDTSIVSGTTDYGLNFTSMIWKDNVFACQFHPEKSQTVGLKILHNFGKYISNEIQ